MNLEQNWRAALNRTCRWLIQRIMSTELESNNAMEPNRTGSEAMAGGNKMPTNSNITRADRNFEHVLRSKHETKIDSNSNNNASKQGHSPLKNGDSLKLNSYEHFQDGASRLKSDCLSQVAHLRQLLLLHLELIQQQQEQIQNKDKELNRLKLEKEQLESRLHRMDRRAAMKRKRSDVYDGDVIPEKSVQSAKLVTPKSRRVSVEQLIRSKRVPATASVTMTSSMCEDIGYETNMRTELLYLHNRPTSFSVQTLETTKKVKQKDKEDVAVPTWCLNEVNPSKIGKGTMATRNSSSSLITGEVECLDDDVFSKRHSKQEADEKRRKRWDIQQYRARKQHESLEKRHREREDAQLKGRKSHGKDKEIDNLHEMASFLPSVNNVMALEISDTVPVVAFGAPVPVCHAREFDLPWFSLDKRELQERKGKAKISRGGRRGRGRGRGGWGRGHYKFVCSWRRS